MKFRDGDTFDHYRIRSFAFEGSTGDVYQALDVQTGREVALKIPLRSVILDAAHYEQFLRELEATRILQNPAVQRGVESGRYDNMPYPATDYLSEMWIKLSYEMCILTLYTQG